MEITLERFGLQEETIHGWERRARDTFGKTREGQGQQPSQAALQGAGTRQLGISIASFSTQSHAGPLLVKDIQHR